MMLSDVLEELERSKLSFRDELYSENFYKTLHNITDFNGYIKDCSSLDNLKLGRGIKKICAKVLKYLDTIHKETYKKDDPYDVCLLLNYWVYSRLFDILQIRGESSVHIAYGNLQSIWTGFLLDKGYQNLCKPITEMVNHNDWRKRKELYEYYVDYDQIMQYKEHIPKRCREIYQYIGSKKTLYEHFKDRCPSSDENKCPKFYAQCLQYHPENVLPRLHCNDEIMQERPAADSRMPQLLSGHLDSESDSEEGYDGMMPFNAPPSNAKPHNVRMYGNVLLGVVATTMTSGTLYRFTPLGGMIRNGLGWNNNNMSNINGGDIRLYDYASEPFNPYPGEEHYIGYHPA
ncbi:unnamed protein product [Plasmodium vivax]|uniref:(malaria parasite P. vivax) hypothetical protein n=1 Tax=Plasmodium vivax TaxID=5855 RepID=A0A8S4HDM5_PLAVI|nr:unnamed protein product [Plasmodium vivax]